MPKIAATLTDRQVRALKKPGLHAVGGVPGLALQVTPTREGGLARSWVLRTMIGGRRRALGLGSFAIRDLKSARDAAAEMLRTIKLDGRDVLAEKRAKREQDSVRAARAKTFRQCADAYIELHRASWKNAKHAAQWESTLSTYAFPEFGDKSVAAVDKADVLAVVEPLWATKHETASRLRGRIELVLQWAVQRGYRPEGPNPAALAGLGLPRANKVSKVEHHAALPYAQAAVFMQQLRDAQGMGARALEFAILTAARSGEVRGATWAEIDLEHALWTIPAERMKGGVEHVVPLSPAAVKLLKALPRFEGCNLVFPNKREGVLSDMTLTAVLRRMKVDVTAHGFRSTFRDWAAEQTNFPREVVEHALAHKLPDKVEAAYQRSSLLPKRTRLMHDWATFLAKPASSEKVISIGRAKKN